MVLRTAPDYLIYVPRTWAVVDFVGVRLHYRRRGIGRALVEAAQDWARQRGAAEMKLCVWEFNEDACSFYEELGCHTVNRRLSYTP